MSSREYFVELERWGIQQGSFGKPPYTDEQWAVAYNNLIGFNEAFKFARDNGYGIISVPRGTYSFCYTNLKGGAETWAMVNTPLKLFSNQIFDLNGSRFEVMYDSINKNPYDKSPATTPAWKLCGKLIEVHECNNTYVINGTIVGDIPNRSFSDGGSGFNSEHGMEHTYGIYFDYGSSNCGAYMLDISMFMGDGITIGCYPVTTNWYISPYDPAALPGYVDSTTSTIIPKDGCYVSEKCFIKPEHRLLEMRTGWGYTRIPRVKNNYVEYVFFDATDKVIGRKRAVYLQTIQVPVGAAYMRVQFLNEDVGLSQFKTTWIIAKPQTRNITISKCDIHNNHRGGISGGADFTTIKYNRIYHNGMDSGIGVPLFPDTTRYAINFEDSYSNKLTIEHNHLFSGFNCLLLGVYHADVKNNYISEFGSSAFTVYNNAFTEIEGNVIYNAGFLGLQGCVDIQERDIIAKNNRVFGGSTNFNTTSHAKTHVKLIDNKFYTDSFTIRGDIEVVNNYFKSYTGKLTNTYTGLNFCVTKFVGNTLEDYNYGTYYRTYILKYTNQSIIKDNIFNSVSFNFPYEVNEWDIYDSDFYNCYFYTFPKDKLKPISIDFNNCKMVDTTVEVGGTWVNNITDNGNITSVNFNRCDISFNEGGKYSSLVNIGDNKSVTELNAGVLPRTYEINLINSKVKSNITSKAMVLVSGYETVMPKRVNAENTTFIVDPTKFDFLKLGSSKATDYYSANIKKCQKVGFTEFVKPKYYPLLEQSEMLFGDTLPTGNIKLNTPFFSTTLLKVLYWNGTEWV